MSLTPAQRRLRARIGAHALHAQYDSRIISAPARAAARKALNDRLLAEIDPGGILSATERARRLEHARKAHYAKLALKSAMSRGKKKAGPPRNGLAGGGADASSPTDSE